MNPQEKPHFRQYLAEGNIICASRAKTVREVLEELADRLVQNTAGLDREEILREVLHREEASPTVVASGLAVPHARMDSVRQLLTAMALVPDGIDFGIPGMPKVQVVILLLTPMQDPGLHLQVLSALARDFKNPADISAVAAQKSPREVMDFLLHTGGEIPQFLRARDVMNRNPVVLRENSTLREAIEVFATSKADEIPVIDDEHTLRGVVSLTDLLKYSLPEHLLWLHDLSSVYQFQPFAEVLQTADETHVADFMRENPDSVRGDIPAVELAQKFILDHLSKLIVTDEDNHLEGEVDIQTFCAELFWK